MKKKLLNNEIRVPKFLEEIPKLEKNQNLFKELQSFFNSPMVIKPRFSVGSRGVYKIRKEKDLIDFLN
ncbi:hypothetical protein J9332_45785, partial [Aquimarina celericrescens]|nr:hypothetical protein [Aquimarina celericrescens]